ncbi:MAG TPA: hypothetical protein VK797_30995 [Tepidisphaeraceae bacterium]|nr:hypothetical protein [Tepidisphaeraceae bacterium]
MEHQIARWLARFELDAFVHAHVSDVVLALPEAVRAELLGDERFLIFDYEPGPGVVAHVPVGMPVARRASRSVVLKRTLRRRAPEFVRYVIAHELAHAHLRNGGRWPGDDPERAADALAAEWGFPRPF